MIEFPPSGPSPSEASHEEAGTRAPGTGPEPAAQPFDTSEQFPGGSHTPASHSPASPSEASVEATSVNASGQGVPLQPAPTPTNPPHRRSTFAGIPVQSAEDVMRCRMEQVVKHGHTLEADRQRSLHDMVKVAAAQMAGALDYAHFRRSDAARRYLVRTAALCLAAIDWIDAEAAETKTGEASPHAGPAEDRT